MNTYWICPRVLTFVAVSLLAVVPHVGGETKAPAKAKVVPANPVMAPVVDEPGLPRVLLIGDSISMGYTLPVREVLKGQANVHRVPTNGGPTTRGLEQLDQWLGEGKWDVIHFNWGLHDLKYVLSGSDKLVDVKSPEARRQVEPAAYEANLRQLVARLKKTGATLVWCSTTPVPVGAKGRVPGDETEYNLIAKRIMLENNIRINDLEAFARPLLATIQRTADVHFHAEGSRQLAQKVADEIKAVLPAR